MISLSLWRDSRVNISPGYCIHLVVPFQEMTATAQSWIASLARNGLKKLV